MHYNCLFSRSHLLRPAAVLIHTELFQHNLLLTHIWCSCFKGMVEFFFVLLNLIQYWSPYVTESFCSVPLNDCAVKNQAQNTHFMHKFSLKFCSTAEPFLFRLATFTQSFPLIPRFIYNDMYSHLPPHSQLLDYTVFSDRFSQQNYCD